MRGELVPVGIISALAVLAGAGSVRWQGLPANSHSWGFSNIQTVRVATVPVNDVGRKFFSALKRELCLSALASSCRSWRRRTCG
jgi:hypothetical protein